MSNLKTWLTPSAKTITIALTDEDGLPVNFADHTLMQISATINKVEVKKFALSGDEYSENEITAVAGHVDQCEIEFTAEETEAFINGVFELDLYKERGAVIERELIPAFNVKLPAFA